MAAKLFSVFTGAACAAVLLVSACSSPTPESSSVTAPSAPTTTLPAPTTTLPAPTTTSVSNPGTESTTQTSIAPTAADLIISPDDLGEDWSPLDLSRTPGLSKAFDSFLACTTTQAAQASEIYQWSPEGDLKDMYLVSFVQEFPDGTAAEAQKTTLLGSSTHECIESLTVSAADSIGSRRSISADALVKDAARIQANPRYNAEMLVVSASMGSDSKSYITTWASLMPFVSGRLVATFLRVSAFSSQESPAKASSGSLDAPITSVLERAPDPLPSTAYTEAYELSNTANSYANSIGRTQTTGKDVERAAKDSNVVLRKVAGPAGECWDLVSSDDPTFEGQASITIPAASPRAIPVDLPCNLN